MLGPSLSMARKRIGGLIAVACAVLGGAAMVTATAVLAETGATSHLPADRLAAVDLVVTADQACTETTLQGHNWETAALSTTPVDGTAPDGPGELALDTSTAADLGLAVGDTVTVATATGTGPYLVTGLDDAPGVHFDPATATALAAPPGGVDLIAATVTGDPEKVAADVRDALAG